MVIDNSVVMAWCFEDETNAYADGVLEKMAETTAFVPSVWSLEVVNVLLVAERRKRLKQAESVRFIALLNQLPIIVDQDRPEKMLSELLALGRSTGLSSYDAAYLHLAMKNDCPLATVD
ncbi:MAG: type II toxin-antitoxin system VapC family toxin [Deltaproteobacteria bacterium]|nr:type II toxin-antitoxin system VapC family toxin [Deltaproteobacteria bacterium]